MLLLLTWTAKRTLLFLAFIAFPKNSLFFQRVSIFSCLSDFAPNRKDPPSASMAGSSSQTRFLISKGWICNMFHPMIAVTSFATTPEKKNINKLCLAL